VAFRPGDREVWASETMRHGPDSIVIAAVGEDGAPGRIDRIRFPGHPVPASIAFSADGKTAYVALSRNNSVAVIDVEARRLLREVSVGMAPFGVVVARRRGTVFVSNRGGRRPRPGDNVAPSSGSEIVTDPTTGAAVSGTVSAIEPESFAVREAEVGLAPSGLALSPDEGTLAVANGHSDSVTLLDTESLAATRIDIPAWPETSLGSQPAAVVFSPDGKTLYAACGGTNAIAALVKEDTGWRVAGAVPTAWFPSALAIDRDGALRVIDIKGVGNTALPGGGFNSKHYEGALERIPAPGAPQLAAGAREVRAANSPQLEPAGGVANLASLGIRYVFFIIKENRTYDQVFGDIAKGNGDPKLVMYGRAVTPNHHALAERYVLLDNFYTSSAISFDGHQWLMQAFVSDYVERAFAASPRGYAWNMADALVVSPAGFFWQSAARPIDVGIYGEFCLPGRYDAATGLAKDMNEADVMSWSDYWRLYKAGKHQAAVGCRSGVPALARFEDPRYPYSSTSISDQLRAEEFLRDLAERDKNGRMPSLNVIHLTSDHTNGTRPGSPTPRAMVADGDLALGRIVEGISRSRLWPKSLVLAVEDDAQDGVDHVDGRRTVALAIGPYVRRGAVDSNNYNHSSLVRTIQTIFGIPARTRALQSARPMTSMFTAEADPAPYECRKAEVALDEMNPPLEGLDGRRLWAARQSLAMNWSSPDDIRSSVLNRILWWDSKGYDAPYPKPH
jgi:YVTN family beta-propeller protein